MSDGTRTRGRRDHSPGSATCDHAVLDRAQLLYFWLAGLAGYSEPFSQLPVLSVALVTVFMTAPMTAWMSYRLMPRRAII